MLSRATGAPRSLYLLCAIALLLVAPARVSAQSATTESGAVRAAITGEPDTETGEVKLLVGRSAVVNIGQPIARVSLTRPEIADAMVTGSQQLLIHGKTPGTISMFVWDRSGGIKRYAVIVARDLSLLGEQLQQLFPGDTIAVTGNGKDVVLSGTVSSKYVIEKAAEVAAGYVEKKDDVVNLLRQQEGVASDQVLLRVRFAELTRNAVTELGLSLFSDGKENYLGSSTTQQFAAPFFDQNKAMVNDHLVFSDYLNLFLFNKEHQLGLTLRALQNRGLFQSLAEPNLIAQNGKEASFLAGGEYPYPVVQGTGSNLAVTIVFKEFGIRLNFTPTLLGGDLVHLKVRPEVSTLDFANAVTYQGFRIPSLSTRRAETEIELQDGQTFAIAGLLNNTVSSTMSKIPGIGDIPILGYLFRSKAAQKQQTELVVMITPQILRKGSTGAAAALPNLVEPYLPAPKKVLPQAAPRLPGGQDDTQPAPATPSAPPAAKQANPSVVTAPAAAPRSQPTDRRTQPPGVLPSTLQQAQPAPAQSAPARVGAVEAPVPAAAPVAATPPIDEQKLAEDRRALEKALAEKKEADKKAEERAARELKQKQEADGRELARQRELDTKRREAEAKQAEERRKAEAKQAEEQRRAEVLKAEEQVRAERARLQLAQKQAEEARKADEKAAKERAKRDAEAARQAVDLQKKQTDAEKKRLKEIQDAVERLNAAQAAYQAAVEKAKKPGDQK